MLEKLRSKTSSLMGSAVLVAGLLGGPGVSIVVAEVLRVTVSAAATDHLVEGQSSLVAPQTGDDRGPEMTVHITSS